MLENSLDSITEVFVFESVQQIEILEETILKVEKSRECSKEDIMPYKNANGDIFPEEELVKAHKKWVGKPLCKDHKSESFLEAKGYFELS